MIDIWHRLELPKDATAVELDRFYTERSERLLKVGNVFYSPFIYYGGSCGIEEYVLINKTCELDGKLLLVACKKGKRSETKLISWKGIIHNYELGDFFINKSDAETILKEALERRLSDFTTNNHQRTQNDG